MIEEHQDDEGDEISPCANNDLVYLRLYQNQLKELAVNAAFRDSAFETSDEIIDLNDLI